MDGKKIVGTGLIIGGVAFALYSNPKIPGTNLRPFPWTPGDFRLPDLPDIFPSNIPQAIKDFFKASYDWEDAKRWELIKQRFELGEYSDWFFNVRFKTQPIENFADSYRKYIDNAGILYGEWNFHKTSWNFNNWLFSHEQPDSKPSWKYSTIAQDQPTQGDIFDGLGFVSITDQIIGRWNTSTWDLYWAALNDYHSALKALENSVIIKFLTGV